MKYYKDLPCNNYNEINQEILNFVTSTVDIDNFQSFWNPIPVTSFVKNTPLFQEWTKKQNLQIIALAVTVGKHANCCGPHIDTPPSIYKLSWPIQHTETTYNRWFQELTDQCTIIVNQWNGRNYVDLSQLKEIHRKKVDGPMLIYAGIPHDVWFEEESKFPRLGLQCQLLREPVSL